MPGDGNGREGESRSGGGEELPKGKRKLLGVMDMSICLTVTVVLRMYANGTS